MAPQQGEKTASPQEAAASRVLEPRPSHSQPRTRTTVPHHRPHRFTALDGFFSTHHAAWHHWIPRNTAENCAIGLQPGRASWSRLEVRIRVEALWRRVSIVASSFDWFDKSARPPGSPCLSPPSLDKSSRCVSRCRKAHHGCTRTVMPQAPSRPLGVIVPSPKRAQSTNIDAARFLHWQQGFPTAVVRRYVCGNANANPR